MHGAGCETGATGSINEARCDADVLQPTELFVIDLCRALITFSNFAFKVARVLRGAWKTLWVREC